MNRLTEGVALLRLMVFVMITLLLVAHLTRPAHAGPLDLEQFGEYIYKQAKDRGVVATLVSMNGEKAVAVALHVGVTKRQQYAAFAVGAEYHEAADSFRLLVATPVNLFAMTRTAAAWGPLARNIDFMPLPPGWELWAGPFCRIPTSQFKDWTWRTHTGGYLSLGKKWGPGGDTEASP